MLTLAFIYFWECLYLCILFLLLQPKAAQNKPAPLTKGAVRDNLPPVARALALHEFKMAPHVKTRSNTSYYKESLVKRCLILGSCRIGKKAPSQ